MANLQDNIIVEIAVFHYTGLTLRMVNELEPMLFLHDMFCKSFPDNYFISHEPINQWLLSAFREQD